MLRSTIVMLGTASLSVLLGQAGTARAQGFVESPPDVETETREEEVAAPDRAFELTLGSGYTRGFGSLQEGPEQDVDDRIGNGVTFELGLGYRASPRWMFGVTGGYQRYESGDEVPEAISSHGASARLDATYHSRPYSRLDPWVKGGVGYRLIYESDAPLAMDEARFHGFDIASVNLGLDLRAGPAFAVAPFVGADLTTFLWEGEDTIDDPMLSTFLYAGLQFRLDVAGDTARSRDVASR
jgi:hypothetical protein